MNYDIQEFKSKFEDSLENIKNCYKAYKDIVYGLKQILTDLMHDRTPEYAHQIMQDKLIDEVEKYGENALNNTNFLSGYFSSDREIREIYRLSLQQINKMQNKYDKEENEETRHKIRKK